MLNGKIDLRSDTIAHPCEGMREVMAQAIVGDDVLGDDPTVANLEQNVADLLGKEASLYTPSGTMANQLGIRVQTRPGDEIILDANAHIYCYEAGAPAALAGVQVSLLDGQRGQFTAAQLEAALPPRDDHFAPPSLVCVENTHNRGGGAVYPMDSLRAIRDIARDGGVPLHMDGARVFNAGAASDTPVAEIARPASTLSFCLSKGLGAPFGSLVAGPKDLIEEARRYRQVFGGGMRQAGIMAAAGRYALKHNVERLPEDHARAGRLAEGLAAIPGVTLPFGITPTNIVVFDIAGTDRTAQALAAALKERGVLVSVLGETRFRALTHLDISDEDIDQALQEIGVCLKF